MNKNDISNLLINYCDSDYSKLTNKDFTIFPDNSVDVHVNITIRREIVNNGQLLIKFNKADCTFDCHEIELTSLFGCPNTVGGDFYYPYNRLTSLEHCPISVGKFFICSKNSKKFTVNEVKQHCPNIARTIYV